MLEGKDVANAGGGGLLDHAAYLQLLGHPFQLTPQRCALLSQFRNLSVALCDARQALEEGHNGAPVKELVAAARQPMGGCHSDVCVTGRMRPGDGDPRAARESCCATHVLGEGGRDTAYVAFKGLFTRGEGRSQI